MSPEKFDIKCRTCGQSEVEFATRVEVESLGREFGRVFYADIKCKNCGATETTRHPHAYTIHEWYD